MSANRRGRSRRSAQVPSDATAVLTAHHQARFNTFYCREPYLQFGGRQEAVDPRAGLGLFGPYDVADESRRTAIRLGVIAPGPLVDLTRSWIERCQSKI